MLEDGPKLRLFARVSLRFSRSASDSRLRDHLLFFCNWKSHPWNILPGTKCHPNITNYLPQNLHQISTNFPTGLVTVITIVVILIVLIIILIREGAKCRGSKEESKPVSG